MATPPRSAGSTPEKPALPWRIEHDVLVAGALRLAAQRIGIGHWRPGERLRTVWADGSAQVEVLQVRLDAMPDPAAPK